MEVLNKLLYSTAQICRQDKALDLLLQLNEQVKSFLGCKKSMIVPIDSYLQHVVTSKEINSAEFLQYARDIQFNDESTGRMRTLTAVTKTAEDVQDLYIKTWGQLDEMLEIHPDG